MRPFGKHLNVDMLRDPQACGMITQFAFMNI